MKTLDLKEYLTLNIPDFSKKIFGLELAPFHKKAIAMALEYNLSFAKIPRGHGKTTLFGQIYPAWRLAQDSRWQIINCSNKFDIAIGSVEVVKQVLELLGKKPSRKTIAGPWSRSSFILDRPYLSKDFSYKAISETTEDTGIHGHIIIIDDLVTRKTTYTELRRKKQIDFVDATLQNMLLPGGQIVWTGNHWDYRDTYVVIVDRRGKDGAKLFQENKNYLEFKAVIDRDKEEVLWPEHFTYEQLMDIEDKITPIQFACQYLNDPSALEGRYFNRDWIVFQDFKSLSAIKEFADSLFITQAWDIAWTIGEESDYTVCVTLGYDDKTSRFYILDIERIQISPTEIPQLMQEQYVVWKPSQIIFEDVGKEGKAVESFLAIKEVSLPINPIKHPSGVKKEDRILRGIGKWYRNLAVYHPTLREEPLSWFKHLEEEYIQFPRSKHDDILDALEMGIRGTIEYSVSPPQYLPYTSEYINRMIGV